MLLLEDVGERPYRLDRMWTHLRLAGVFERVSGIVLGDFTDCEEKNAAYTSADVLRSLAEETGLPCAAGFPIGHGALNYPVPAGHPRALGRGRGAPHLPRRSGARMSHPIGNLQTCLDEAVAGGLFPAAQAVVLHRGVQVFGGVAGAATGDTRFDLASVTKVLCTTSLFLRLWTEGKVGPETPVARYFPGSPVAEAGATVADLLYHRSGLPPFVPFFAQALTAHPGAARRRPVPRPLAPRSARKSSRPPPAPRSPLPPRTRTAYSDVGFILLGEILSRAAGAPLDILFPRYIAEPLGLCARFHRLSELPTDGKVAPTGATRPREPAPGQEGLWGDAAHPAQPSRRGG